MLSKYKSNYLYNLLITVVNLLFPILSFPYAARIIGPLGIGKVQFITSFAQYFALIAALGIPIYGIREIAKVKNDPIQLSRTFTELLIVTFISSFISGFLYIIIVFSLNNFKNDILYYTYASLIVFLNFSSIDWFYAGIEKFKTIALRSAMVKLLALICLFIFVHSKEHLFIYFLISIFTIIGNNLINIVSVCVKAPFNTKELNFKKHQTPMLLIFATMLATSMYTILDVVILGFLSDEKSVGYYTAGVKLIKITIPFVTSLGAVLMAKITAHLQDENLDGFYKIIAKSYSFLVLLSVPIGLGFLLLSKEFIVVFSGSQFLPSIQSMQILAFLPLLIGIGHLFSIQMLIPAKMDKELFISVLLGMVTSLFFNFLLIPNFKQNGASIANLISEAVVTCSYYYFIRKKFVINFGFKYFFRCILSALVFIPIVYGCKFIFNNNLYILLSSVFIGAISYLAVQYYLFKNEVITEILAFPLIKIKNNAIN